MIPMSENPTPVKKQLLSFKYAFNGIRLFMVSERHAKIHLLAAIIVIILGWFFSISAIEWCLLIFAIGLVFVTEMINTSIEKITDKINPEYGKIAGLIKDISAGAVLISAITALCIGLIIFLPKIV